MKKIISIIKNNKLILLFSFVESFLSIYGTMLVADNSLKDFNLILVLVTIVISFILFWINVFYTKIFDIKYEKNYNYIFSKKSLLIKWGIIFLLWVPVLLAYYPTLWAYDVYRQVPHIIGSKVSTNQPVLHTLFIELFLIVGKKINSYEFGMLLLSLIQMLAMSLIFSYSIEKIKTFIGNKLIINIVTILMIIYYGLIPFNSILSISMTKDVLFSGLFFTIIIYLYDFMDKDSVSISRKILFVFLTLLMLLIKNNMIYVFIIFSIITLFIFKKIKKFYIFKLCLISIVLYFLFSTCLIKLTNAEKGYKFESYSVQIQNLIYVAKNHEDEITVNNKLFNIFPRDCFEYDLKYYYYKSRVDRAKEPLEACIGNKFNDYKLITTWIKYGLKYREEYIDSWSNLTIGSWYLFDESHANTYPGYMQGYLLTDFKSFNGLKLIRPKSKFLWLRKKLEKIATNNVQYKDNLILRFLFVPSTYILSFFLMITYIIQNRLSKELIPLLLPICLYISILFGPVIIVRYIYPFMVIVPFIYVRLISKKET